MPKQVDNYILERKIGAGQFGEVFKGFNKNTGQDVAVKVIRRDLLKGKFLELLENEIKVLKSCDNPNIMKLYDMKKTANNFYLITEYCNEGDLGDYLKQKKYLTEDEAVEYFLQIMNGFKTLVKNNIMHRDFKLANILKHNGTVKIADFGFSKLLGKEGITGTMLGSPLNMAPEVLDGAMYNNKADIWSIGTVFYELLFGRPPFLASNMIELMKNIKQKKLDIPKKINNISPEAEDALRKMLTVDPHNRIDWDELFKHPITFYREEKIKKELEDTLKAHDLNLVLNISKFYINNNKVVQHVADINKKQDLNNYTREIAKGQKKEQYKGPIFNEDKNREDEEEKKREEPKSSQKGNETDNSDLADLTTQETMRESLIKTVKRNSNRILHERNKYVFLASVAEDAISKGLELSEYAGFVLVKKLLMMIENLKVNLTNNVNMFKLEEWGHYVKTKEYRAILDYIKGEYDVFEVYYNCMYDRITNVKKVHPKIGVDFLGIVTKNLNEKIDKVYSNTLKDYTDEILLALNKVNNPEEAKNLWLHADQIIDCMKLDERFVFEDSNKKQFNFRQFYEEIKNLDVDKISTRVKEKVKTI
jgi:serine/threonine-protein kinase ULK/ATG1